MTSVVTCGLEDSSLIALTVAASSRQAYLADMAEMAGGGLLLHLLLIICAAT